MIAYNEELQPNPANHWLDLVSQMFVYLEEGCLIELVVADFERGIKVAGTVPKMQMRRQWQRI